MTNHPSVAKFTAFVQLKDFRGPTKKEYVRYVRRLGDHYQCDPATLSEDQVRAYYLELRQVRKFGSSAMKVAKCALRAFFQDCLGINGWTVFQAVRIVPPRNLPLVLAREPVATLLKAVELPRYGTGLAAVVEVAELGNSPAIHGWGGDRAGASSPVRDDRTRQTDEPFFRPCRDWHGWLGLTQR